MEAESKSRRLETEAREAVERAVRVDGPTRDRSDGQRPGIGGI